MKNKDSKGKHLTLDDRINILNELIKGSSLGTISTKIGKDPTTISKEIKLHRYCKESKPTTYNNSTKCKSCTNFEHCENMNLCDNEHCSKFCKFCYWKNVIELCPNYNKRTCKTTSRFPYTCNGCNKKKNCRLDKYYYDPKLAQKEYEDSLVNSRTGANITQDELDELDKIVSDGIKKGKSIYSIILNNPTIIKSERTLYRYVGKRYLEAKDIDLRNKVKMKPRKSYKDDLTKEKKEQKKETIEPRNYDAYAKFLASQRISFIPQIDLVQGLKGEGEPYLMTFIFPFSNLMFGRLIKTKEQKEIVKVFDDLEEVLGIEDFKKLFPAILTDRGNEFLDADGIELSKDNTKRTNLFYCDPYSSYQKAEIERNHEFFRYFSPKEKSIKEYTQEEINLIFSHINSYNRKSKDHRTPYEMFEFVYGKDILDKLGIKKIDFNEIDLTRNLIIQYRKNN